MILLSNYYAAAISAELLVAVFESLLNVQDDLWSARLLLLLA